MEVDVMLIDDVREIAVEPPLRALLHDVELREQRLGWRRQSAGHRFVQHALRGDERRAGKTAKLIDLCARLKCGAL
jgi:CRISPR/Cas system-associated protein Cas10 (large subunit of type III CRISPR-Cas system)